MKITLKGRITEVGCNYATDDGPHAGVIIQQNGQNLHFNLDPATTRLLAEHLFEEVMITITTEKPKK